MKNTGIILGVALLLSSCMSTKKFNRIVTNEYQSQDTFQLIKNDLIRFQEHKTDSNVLIKKMEKTKSKFIPALFYWNWGNIIDFEINKKSLEKIIEQSFFENPKISDLEDALDGKQLVVKIKDMPNEYFYTNQGEIIIVIVYYQVGTVKGIYPKEKNFIFSYQLFDRDILIKEGVIALDRNDIHTDNTNGSTKKLAKYHFREYRNNTKYMTTELIRKLYYEIKY